MRQAWRGWLPAVLLCMGGCHYTTTTEVTADPRFRCGYAAGQAWRLKTPAYLVDHRPSACAACERVLWTESAYRRLAAQSRGHPDPDLALVAVIPPGTTVQIRRLQYTEDVYLTLDVFLPRLEMLVAVGTLTTPTAVWSDVIAPGVIQTRPVAHVDGVLLTRPNLDMVEPAAVPSE